MRRFAFFAAIPCVLVAVSARGDVLVLRDGDRLRGQLISVSATRVEFEDDRGNVQKIPRSDVERIEFDRSGRSSPSSRDEESGPPRGARERETTVGAAQGWTDTGIDLRTGQDVYFRARGEIRWGPKRSDGPAGESGSPRNPGRPIPNRPAAALIGRVGSSGDPFFIGDERGAIQVRGHGRLFLGINDDYLQDNAGSFRVTVYY